jgi:tetratricopeptide (TPR) repeat protein
MARFDKLEFGSRSTSESAQELTGRREMDSATWATRADQSRRLGSYESALQFYSRALEDDKTYVAGWVGQVQMLVQLEEYPEAEVWSRKAIELFPAEGDLHASRAQSLIRLQRKKEAFAAADAAMSQRGQSAYRWSVRGELLLADRQKTDRHCFDKALQVDDDWLVPAEIALICLHYGQPGSALSRARAAVERDSRAAYAWYLQGVCQAELGLSVPARRSFEACLDLHPGFRGVEEQLRATDGNGSIWKRLRGLWSR